MELRSKIPTRAETGNEARARVWGILQVIGMEVHSDGSSYEGGETTSVVWHNAKGHKVIMELTYDMFAEYCSRWPVLTVLAKGTIEQFHSLPDGNTVYLPPSGELTGEASERYTTRLADRLELMKDMILGDPSKRYVQVGTAYSMESRGY